MRGWRVGLTQVVVLDCVVRAVGGRGENVGGKGARMAPGVLAEVVDAFVLLPDDGVAEGIESEGSITLAGMGRVRARAEGG